MQSKWFDDDENWIEGCMLSYVMLCYVQSKWFDDDENWAEGCMLSSGKGGFKLPPTFQFRLIIKVEYKDFFSEIIKVECKEFFFKNM